MSSIPLRLDDQTLSIVTQIAESMPGGFFIYHADGDEGFIYINSAMLRIFGCDTEEEFIALTKNSFHTMVHPDDIDEVEKSIAEQIENSVHDLDYVEYRIIRKDGAVRWIVDYGHFIHTEAYGDVFFVFIDDATEKKQLEIEEKRKTTVIEGLSNGFNSIYLVNIQENTMSPYAWNDPVSKEMVEQTFHNSMTEVNFDKFNAEFAEKYIIYDDRDNYIDTVSRKNIKEKIKAKEDIRHVFHCDEGEYLEVSISHIKESENLAVMALKNVTEQMQKVKAEAIEKLRIEQERDNAIHASNTKSAFLFNMSHDLKTPINAIAGFAEIARRNIDGDKKKLAEYLENINKSSALLVELINDVLNMTEIESGNLVIKKAPCNLNDQISLLGDVFRPQISGKYITYSVTTKIKHDCVIADALNLKRVLSNLLQNAVSYTPEGGSVSLEVTETKKLGLFNNSYNYVFKISDTGCGMSREFMERMYTAFERAHNTTASQVSGTGLGLTITKNLVDAMNGKIEAQSEEGKGTTFTVTIPLEATLESPVATSAQEEQGWIRSSHGKTKRVLVVEDNELNREIALEILHQANIEADAACDGQEAVEIFSARREHYYDLILMDIQMPRMNGYDAVKAIRALPRADVRTMPIFAMTANTLEKDKVRAYESGMDKVIEKPVNIDLFTDVLSKI